MKRRREDQNESLVGHHDALVRHDIGALWRLFQSSEETPDNSDEIKELCHVLGLRPLKIKQDTEYVHAEVRRRFIEHVLKHEWTPQIWLFLSIRDLHTFCFPEALESSDYWKFWFECSLVVWPQKLKDLRKIVRGIDAQTFLHRIQPFATDNPQEMLWETFIVKSRHDLQSQMLRAIQVILQFGPWDEHGYMRDEALLLLNDYHISNYEMRDFFRITSIPYRKLGTALISIVNKGRLNQRELTNGMKVYISLANVAKRIFAVRKNPDKDRSLLVYSRLDHYLEERWVICHCIDGTKQTIQFATRFGMCQHFGGQVKIGMYEPVPTIVYIACFHCNRYLFLDALNGTRLSLVEIVGDDVPTLLSRMSSYQEEIEILFDSGEFRVLRLFHELRDEKEYYMMQKHKFGPYIDVSRYREVLNILDYDKHLAIAAFFDDRLDESVLLRHDQLIVTPDRKHVLLVPRDRQTEDEQKRGSISSAIQKPFVMRPEGVSDKSSLQGVFDNDIAVWFVKERGWAIWQDLKTGIHTMVSTPREHSLNCLKMYVDPWTLDIYFIQFNGKGCVVRRPSSCEWCDDAMYQSVCTLLHDLLAIFLPTELRIIIQHYLCQVPRFEDLGHVFTEFADHSPLFVTPTMMCI